MKGGLSSLVLLVVFVVKFSSSMTVNTIPAKEILDGWGEEGSKLLSCDDISEPLVILDAIPLEERKKWWTHITTRSKNELVRVNRQHLNTADFEMELIHALELIEQQSDDGPVLLTSIGSSCSMDQLPIYDWSQSFFQEPDILCHFSPYTPMHDSLIVSSNNAVSTLCSRAYSTIVICLGGGAIEWWLQPQTDSNLKRYHASRSVTRTWEGDSFSSMGFNSGSTIIDLAEDHTTTTVTCLKLSPGDILVIPQNWWFQNRATDKRANISIHSKRCEESQFSSLVEGFTDIDLLFPTLAKLSGIEVQIEKLFELLKQQQQQQ